MLGTIFDNWVKSESVDIKEGDKFIIIRGKLLEVTVEEKKHLRLSLVDLVDNEDEQHYEAVSTLMNSLDQHRKDLTILNHELREITNKLDTEELKDDMEDDLERQAREKRAQKRFHAKEIRKLEDETAALTDSIVEPGPSAVLPPGLTLHPEFLSEPICWCPYNFPESTLVHETITMVEEMPINMTFSRHFKDCAPDEESVKDTQEQPSNAGCDKYNLESKEAEIK